LEYPFLEVPKFLTTNCAFTPKANNRKEKENKNLVFMPQRYFEVKR
jgi:hypothetical protein